MIKNTGSKYHCTIQLKCKCVGLMLCIEVKCGPWWWRPCDSCLCGAAAAAAAHPFCTLEVTQIFCNLAVLDARSSELKGKGIQAGGRQPIVERLALFQPLGSGNPVANLVRWNPCTGLHMGSNKLTMVFIMLHMDIIGIFKRRVRSQNTLHSKIHGSHTHFQFTALEHTINSGVPKMGFIQSRNQLSTTDCVLN